jgi:hypothetical protein
MSERADTPSGRYMVRLLTTSNQFTTQASDFRYITLENGQDDTVNAETFDFNQLRKAQAANMCLITITPACERAMKKYELFATCGQSSKGIYMHNSARSL